MIAENVRDVIINTNTILFDETLLQPFYDKGPVFACWFTWYIARIN